jgi:hypothetical protein
MALNDNKNKVRLIDLKTTTTKKNIKIIKAT